MNTLSRATPLSPGQRSELESVAHKILRTEAVHQDVWTWLQPSDPTRQFLPASIVAMVSVLYVTGHVFDLVAISLAIILAPSIAFALGLIYRPFVKRIASPVEAVSRLSTKVVDALSKSVRLTPYRRTRLELAVIRKMQPIVTEQFDDFWQKRAVEPELDRPLRDAEVRLVSLSFLTTIYFLVGFLEIMISLQSYRYYSTSFPSQFLLAFGILSVGLLFLAALTGELQSYKLMLRIRIPVLNVAEIGTDSEFWDAYVKFAESRRSALGDYVTDEIKASAEFKKRRTAKGEVVREFIVSRVAQDAGEDRNIVDLLLKAVTSVKGEPRILPLSPLLPLVVVAFLVTGFATVVIGRGDGQEAATTLSLALAAALSVSAAYVSVMFASYRIRQGKQVSEQVEQGLQGAYEAMIYSALKSGLGDRARRHIEIGSEESRTDFLAAVGQEEIRLEFKLRSKVLDIREASSIVEVLAKAGGTRRTVVLTNVPVTAKAAKVGQENGVRFVGGVTDYNSLLGALKVLGLLK